MTQQSDLNEQVRQAVGQISRGSVKGVKQHAGAFRPFNPYAPDEFVPRTTIDGAEIYEIEFTVKRGGATDGLTRLDQWLKDAVQLEYFAVWDISIKHKAVTDTVTYVIVATCLA